MTWTAPEITRHMAEVESDLGVYTREVQAARETTLGRSLDETFTDPQSSAPRQRFVRITAGLTALSCVAPAAFADTTASKIALVGLHILAAAMIVPVLARRAN